MTLITAKPSQNVLGDLVHLVEVEGNFAVYVNVYPAFSIWNRILRQALSLIQYAQCFSPLTELVLR